MKSSRSIHSSRENGLARLPHSGFWVIRREALLFLSFRIVVDDELDWIEHGYAAR